MPDTAASYPLPLNHFNRNAHAQHRVVLEKGGRAGTAVPDAAASYTQQRGPDPLTKANDSRIERESGHGCARRRCIIYSNERGWGWGAGTAVPDTATSYTPPPTHFNRKPERKAYPRITARGGSKERESGHG